jgi:non-ribosomal peptide synthetase component F
MEYLETGALITNPEKIAIKDEFSEISFKELNYNSDKLGTFIAEMIPQNNALIAVYLPKSIETIISNLSVIKSGNFYTNLDDKSPIDRLQKLLNNIVPDLIITNSQLIKTLRQFDIDNDKIICIDSLIFNDMRVGTELLLERRSTVIDTDPLCLINTSGSTGIPKSVVLNHRSTIDFVDWCFTNFEFKSSDSIGNLSPLYFDIYTLELFICLYKASTLNLIPEKTATFPAQLAQFLSDEKITFIFWVPTIMVNIANLGLLDKFNFTNLRRIFFAGEVFSTKHLNIWRKALPNAQFVNLYGPIEITIDCTYFIVNRDFQDNEPIPIGIPCRNSGVFILAEDGCVADM